MSRRQPYAKVKPFIDDLNAIKDALMEEADNWRNELILVAGEGRGEASPSRRLREAPLSPDDGDAWPLEVSRRPARRGSHCLELQSPIGRPHRTPSASSHRRALAELANKSVESSGRGSMPPLAFCIGGLSSPIRTFDIGGDAPPPPPPRAAAAPPPTGRLGVVPPELQDDVRLLVAPTLYEDALEELMGIKALAVYQEDKRRGTIHEETIKWMLDEYPNTPLGRWLTKLIEFAGGWENIADIFVNFNRGVDGTASVNGITKKGWHKDQVTASAKGRFIINYAGAGENGRLLVELPDKSVSAIEFGRGTALQATRRVLAEWQHAHGNMKPNVTVVISYKDALREQATPFELAAARDAQPELHIADHLLPWLPLLMFHGADRGFVGGGSARRCALALLAGWRGTHQCPRARGAS